MPDVSKASYCVQHVVGQRLRGETKVLRREEVQPLDAFEHVDNFFVSKNLPRRNFLFVEIRLNAFARLTEFLPFVNF